MKNREFEEIFKAVEEMLEKGIVPWQKPWQYGRNMNLLTKKKYHIFNDLILHSKGFLSPYWLTEKQLQKLGGVVKRGSQPATIYAWGWPPYTNDEDGGDELRFKRFPICAKKIKVYNTEQCKGIEKYVPDYKNIDFVPLEKAEQIINNMPDRPEIIEGRHKAAFYRYSEDRVYIPHRESFISLESYYATLFHELVHATGHKKRLGRIDPDDIDFGSYRYSKEELVAELGAYALCTECRIGNRIVEDSASYVAGWLDRLYRDWTILSDASMQADKAVKFIMEGHKKTKQRKKYRKRSKKRPANEARVAV